MKWRQMGRMLVGTAALSGAILLIIGTATAMAWGLTQSGFSGWLADTMSPHGVAARRCSWPCPSSRSSSSARCSKASRRWCCSARCCSRSRAQLGIHEVHYAMVATLAMGLGLFAPPLGVGLLLGLRDRAREPRQAASGR